MSSQNDLHTPADLSPTRIQYNFDVEVKHDTLVKRLFKPGAVIKEELSDKDCELLHALVGLFCELGELGDIIKGAVFYRKPIDTLHAVEETGDIEFYFRALRNSLKISRSYCLTENIRKLSVRYPEGYSDKRAVDRLDKSSENA